MFGLSMCWRYGYEKRSRVEIGLEGRYTSGQSRRLTRRPELRALPKAVAIFIMNVLLNRPRVLLSGSMYQERSAMSYTHRRSPSIA